MMELDENQLLIARLMQEEEDALKAQELQNDYYSGNRPPTAKGPPARKQREEPSYVNEEPVYDRLISDPRAEVFGVPGIDEDWIMDENFPGFPASSHSRGSGVPAQSHLPRGYMPAGDNDMMMGNTVGGDDDDFQRAIIESMKGHNSEEVNVDDEIM